MSVIVIAKVTGDTGAFTNALSDRAEEFRQVAERARTQGAVHHQFGIGDGFILVSDEWESVDAFQAFFGDPELQAFVASIGGDPTVAPEVLAGESIDSPDRF